MSFTVYIIESTEEHRYIGQTSDLARRITEHNSHLSHSTKHGTGWKPVYAEEHETRAEAMKREKYFKSGKGRDESKTLIAGWSPPRRTSSSGS